jgi:hypothetical protein
LDGLERPDRVVQVTPDMAGRPTLPRLLAKPLEQVAHIELRHSGSEEPDVLSTNRPHVEQFPLGMIVEILDKQGKNPTGVGLRIRRVSVKRTP